MTNVHHTVSNKTLSKQTDSVYYARDQVVARHLVTYSYIYGKILYEYFIAGRRNSMVRKALALPEASL